MENLGCRVRKVRVYKLLFGGSQHIFKKRQIRLRKTTNKKTIKLSSVKNCGSKKYAQAFFSSHLYVKAKNRIENHSVKLTLY